jgi:hypothetical protein
MNFCSPHDLISFNGKRVFNFLMVLYIKQAYINTDVRGAYAGIVFYGFYELEKEVHSVFFSPPKDHKEHKLHKEGFLV